MNERNFVLINLADDAAVVPLLTFLLELEKHQITRTQAFPSFGSAYFALFLGSTWEIDVDLTVASVDQRGAVNAGVGHPAIAIGGAEVLFGFCDDRRDPFSLFAILGIGRGDGYHEKHK